jgi:hypothetical protein
MLEYILKLLRLLSRGGKRLPGRRQAGAPEIPPDMESCEKKLKSIFH